MKDIRVSENQGTRLTEEVIREINGYVNYIRNKRGAKK